MESTKRGKAYKAFVRKQLRAIYLAQSDETELIEIIADSITYGMALAHKAIIGSIKTHRENNDYSA